MPNLSKLPQGAASSPKFSSLMASKCDVFYGNNSLNCLQASRKCSEISFGIKRACSNNCSIFSSCGCLFGGCETSGELAGASELLGPTWLGVVARWPWTGAANIVRERAITSAKPIIIIRRLIDGFILFLLGPWTSSRSAWLSELSVGGLR